MLFSGKYDIVLCSSPSLLGHRKTIRAATKAWLERPHVHVARATQSTVWNAMLCNGDNDNNQQTNVNNNKPQLSNTSADWAQGNNQHNQQSTTPHQPICGGASKPFRSPTEANQLRYQCELALACLRSDLLNLNMSLQWMFAMVNLNMSLQWIAWNDMFSRSLSISFYDCPSHHTAVLPPNGYRPALLPA